MRVSILPDSIPAGLTFQARAILAAYPVGDWVLTLALRGASKIDLTATVDGTAHVFDASAATTAGWLPGTYWYTVRATGEDGVFEVERGSLSITPDIAAAGDQFDGRTHARKVLDAIDAVIEKRATQDQLRYVINNRELWRTPLPELMKFRALYAGMVKREEARAKGKSIFGQQVKFTTGCR